ncbi:glycosyltransferase [Rhodoligotrophos ferricapiens]|uniref:glycosyltransferase n=1 Tax=Rhodoligotrophos ferricapiens TaxID=3069264 RepID=UPI00315DBD3E
MRRVSVVLPTYNRAHSVGRAISSVLAQEFGDFELIIVDDGSTDETEAVIRGFVDDRLIYLKQDVNLGVNAARNRAIAAATGELVCFLDSDDEFLPHKLRTVVDYFEAQPETALLIDSFELSKAGKPGEPCKVRRNPDLDDSAEIERRIYAREIYKATPALNVRRPALMAVGGFDHALERREDMDLALKLARCGKCASTAKVLWRKHWTFGSLSNKSSTFMGAVLGICARHPDYLAKPEFRIGLARDVSRHVFRLALKGHFAAAGGDVRRFIKAHGGLRTAHLMAVGVVEMSRRNFGAGHADAGYGTS